MGARTIRWCFPSQREIRTRLLGRFQAAAPQLAERLQNTQQLMHGAVAEYQSRHDRLSNLLSEAEATRAELQRQRDLHANEARHLSTRLMDEDSQTADDLRARQQESAQQAEELTMLLSEQDDEIESLRVKLAQVRTKLGQLRGQRDNLNARLKLAGVQVRPDDVRPIKARRRRLLILAMAGSTVIAMAALVSMWALQRFAGHLRTNLLSSRNTKPTTNQGYSPQTNKPRS